MSLKAPIEGRWWRLVELNTTIHGARYLTLQSQDYNIIPYRVDFEEYYAGYWSEDKDRMVLNQIGDSYGPWHEGPRPS